MTKLFRKLSFLVLILGLVSTSALIGLISRQSLDVEAADNDVYITGEEGVYGSLLIQNYEELTNLNGIRSVKGVYTDSPDQQMVITESGEVYVWGSQAISPDGESFTTLIGAEGFGLVPNITDAIDGFVSDGVFGIVRSNGTVWIWGSAFNTNVFGFEYFDFNDLTTPTQIPNLNGITKISASGSHVIALRNDGTVWTWGGNSDGELGNGTTSFSPTIEPIQVSGLSNITEVIATPAGSFSGNSSFAITNSGQVYAWGRNNNGQLGLGNNSSVSSPTLISGISNVTKIVSGGGHTAAITSSGQLYTWGLNSNGQLGTGNSTSTNSPTLISSMTEVIDVAIGNQYTSVIRNDIANASTGGTGVWSAGRNGQGQFGNGTLTSSESFTRMHGITRPEKIYSTGNSSVLVANGSTQVGELEIASNEGMILTTQPSGNSMVPISSTSGFINVDGSNGYFIGLKNDDTIWVWSQGDPNPSQVSGLTGGIDSVYVSSYNQLYAVLKDDGSVWVWGYDNSSTGILGLGQSYVGGSLFEPTQISSLTNISYIAIGSTMMSAVSSSGQLYVWGNTSYGRMGIDPANFPTLCDTSTFIPHCHTPVPHPLHTTDAVKVAMGDNTNTDSDDGATLILRNDGSLTAYGADPSSSWNVTGVTNAVDIALDQDTGLSAYVVRNNGTVLSWGTDQFNMLGRPLTQLEIDNSIAVPTQITGISNAVKVGTGNGHASVLLSDGRVMTWGVNASGGGRRYGSSEPTYVLGVTEATDISRNPDSIISGANDPFNGSSGSGGSGGGSGPNPGSGLCSNGNGADTTEGNVTILCMEINAGVLTLFAGDDVDNDDICTNDDNINSTIVDTTPSGESNTSVTCGLPESAANLSSITTTNVRQRTTSVINDIVFEDLRGLPRSMYSITATVSNLVDGSKSISLGQNPDGASSDNDSAAPSGADNGLLFSNLNCSNTTITPLRSRATVNEGILNYQRGSSTTVINPTTPIEIISTSDTVKPGRVDIDGCQLMYRIPSFVQAGNYTGTITYTIT